MPTRTLVAKALAATTILSCFGSGLGSNNTLATGSRSITVAGNTFGPPISPNKPDATITNKDNSLEKDYTIAKLDIKDFFNSPSENLSQHNPKLATPEQQQAYIQKNKEQLLILGMLGIQSTNNANLDISDIKNYNGKITIMLSPIIASPYIPDIFSKMDPATKELMTDISSSKEFIELQSQTIKLFKEQKGTKGVLEYVNGVNANEFKELKFKSIELLKEQKGTEGVLEYANAFLEVLQSAKVKSDIEATKNRIIKNSAPPPEKVSPDESRNSSAIPLSKINRAERAL